MYLENVGKISDEELFKQPPSPYGDCPVCFLRLPTLNTGRRYQSCCGKTICGGCVHAPVYDDQGNIVDNEKCAFCRTPYPTSDEEAVKRERNRMNVMIPLQCTILEIIIGRYGYQLDYAKALEYWHRAGYLGYAGAYCRIGYAYDKGKGVKIDKKKATHYFELAAMGGDLCARQHLGIYEENAGNIIRSIKHHTIAVRGGCPDSLNKIKQLYTIGQASKDVNAWK